VRIRRKTTEQKIYEKSTRITRVKRRIMVKINITVRVRTKIRVRVRIRKQKK